MFKLGILFCLFVFFCGTTTRASDSPWEWDPALSVWLADSLRSLVDSPLNSGNRVSEVPQEVRTLELRPRLKVRKGIWQASVRPRFYVTEDRVKESAAPEKNNWHSKLIWSEAFTTADFNNSLSVSYGLQNFQWGPAEAASFSNQIFHETVQERTLLFETRGRHLFRVNFTPAPNWSEVLLLELTKNGEPEPEYNGVFTPKAALKSEISWAGGVNYFGLVLGAHQRVNQWVGEYANIEVTSGFSLYADAGHQKGSQAYYPGTDPTGHYLVMAQTKKNDPHIYHSVTAGARYSFVGGEDIRLEFIHQDAGYSSSEKLQIWNSFLSSNLNQLIYAGYNAKALRNNGLEFPGKNYLFFSARFPEAFSWRDLTLYVRALHSLLDGSNTIFGSSEIAVGDHGNAFASIVATSGRPSDELRGLIAYEGMVGYRLSW